MADLSQRTGLVEIYGVRQRRITENVLGLLEAGKIPLSPERQYQLARAIGVRQEQVMGEREVVPGRLVRDDDRLAALEAMRERAEGHRRRS